MAVQALHPLQNGFLGAARSLLFYGETTRTCSSAGSTRSDPQFWKTVRQAPDACR